MFIAGRFGKGLLVLALLEGGLHTAGLAQTTPPPTPPATTPQATTPATTTAPATTRAKKPTVAEILSKKTANFDFEDAPIADILKFIGKSFDTEVENHFDLPDRLTMKLNDLGAREAIDIVDAAILAKGYSVLETVRDDDGPPRVVLTVVQTKKDAGSLVPVFNGMDPTQIPEGNELRTQVIVVKYMDLEKNRDLITSVLDKQASITINPATKTLIVTDTGTHVYALAKLLQVLEKQAEGSNK